MGKREELNEKVSKLRTDLSAEWSKKKEKNTGKRDYTKIKQLQMDINFAKKQINELKE